MKTNTMSFYLILAIISLLSSSVLPTEWLDCDPAQSFVVELENDKKVFVFDAEVKLKYNRNALAVYDYPGIDVVNILINNTIVSFTGRIVPENEDIDSPEYKVSRIFSSKVAGFARLLKRKDGVGTLNDYHLFLSRSHSEKELNIPKKVQIEIIHEAVSCLKSTIKDQIGSVTVQDIERAKQHPYDFGSISVLTNNLSVLHSKFANARNDNEPIIDSEEIKQFIFDYSNLDTNNIKETTQVQSIINRMVDLAVAELVKKIREENQGIIKIPDLSQNFSTGSSWWETTGDFDASNGTFADLTTLRRTENAALSHKDFKFTTSSAFGLSLANLKYRNYKLRYGVAKVDGKLSASIDGVEVFAKGSINYNVKPCRAELLELRVSELGEVKVKVTGLAPLNKLLSKLVTLVVKNWRQEIVGELENELRDIVTKHVDRFNCEKYRPF